MPNISDAGMIRDEFDEFWTTKQREAFERLCQEEGIKAEIFNRSSRILYACVNDAVKNDLETLLQQHGIELAVRSKPTWYF